MPISEEIMEINFPKDIAESESDSVLCSDGHCEPRIIYDITSNSNFTKFEKTLLSFGKSISPSTPQKKIEKERKNSKAVL